MMNDDELRARLADRRRRLGRSAPSFEQVLGAPSKAVWRASRVRRRALWLGGLATAAALFMLSTNRAPRSAIAVEEWRADTDVFLPSTSTGVLGELPPLGASVLDAYLPDPTQFTTQSTTQPGIPR